MPASRFRNSNVSAGGCGAIVVFGVFTVAGLLVSGGLFFTAMNETDASGWVPTPGVVRSMKIEADDDPFPPYRVVVAYRYDFGGATYVSDRYAAYARLFDDYGEASREMRAYVVGGPVTCYVNPADPSEAVLLPERSSMTWFAAFPLVFVIVGVGGLYFTLRDRRDATRRAKSVSGPKWAPRLLPVILFAVFFLAGSAVLVAVGLPSLREWLSARSWPAVEATVIDSRVRAHHGDDSPTYSVQVVYEYRVGDQTYRSNRDGLVSGRSSGYEGKERRVRAMRPGAKVTAYVDPNEPTNALLSRSGWWLLLSVGGPGIFTLVGAAGLSYLLRQRLQEPATAGAAVPDRPHAATTPGRLEQFSAGGGSSQAMAAENAPPVELRATGRKGTLIFLVIFALVWNGITWGFALTGGVSDACSLLFMVPFVLAGLGVIAAAIYQLLALANPRAVLTLKPGTLRLGEPFQLDYRFEGRFDRITRLRIVLEGREEATYTRGTRRTTDKRVFREIELLDTDARVQIERGTIRARVPDDTMHSLGAGDSQVTWRFVVKGTIERWPDVDDEFPLEILPLRVPSSTERASWLQ